MPFLELTTSRLKLVALLKEYLPDLFTIYSNERTMRYWDDYPHPNMAKTAKILEIFNRHIKNKTGICSGITFKAENTVIGTVSYNRYQKYGLSVIDYWLSVSGRILEARHDVRSF